MSKLEVNNLQNQSHNVDKCLDSVKKKVKRTPSKKKFKSKKKSQSHYAFISVEEMERYHFESRLKKSKVEYQKYLNNIREQDRKKLEAIEKLMRKFRLPMWYRELSDRQMEAADCLADDIRDDIEEDTIHRCKKRLRTLGIWPLVKEKDIKLALRMCGGSDLAFLWFLRDLFYKKHHSPCSDDQSEYTVNEQILMSSICHLDLTTTLRELDRILPKPDAVEKKTTKCSRIKGESSKSLSAIFKNLHRISPYLEPLPHPKPVKRRPLPPPPLPKQNFPPYHKYSDKTFVVPNEASRWFSDKKYENLESRTVIDSILIDQIEAITNGSIDKNQMLDAMCKKHRTINEIKKSVEILKKLQIHNGCGDTDKKLQIQERVYQKLEIDLVDMKKTVEKLDLKCETEGWVKLFLERIVNSIQKPELSEMIKRGDNVAREIFWDEQVDEEISGKLEEVPVESKFNYGHCGPMKFNASYFSGPKIDRPFYNFDYENIFSHKGLYSDLVKCTKCLINRATDRALQTYKSGDKDQAIEDYMDQCWDDDVNLQYKIHQKNNTDLSADDQIKAKLAAMPRNPRNRKQMENILRKALMAIRENPKFVLASMPEVHRVPLLKEWIRSRYGLKYTTAEREKSLEMSKKTLQMLFSREENLFPPGLTDIHKKKILSYSKKNEIVKKIVDVTKDFYGRVSHKMLQDARIYWLTMEPYHCSIESVRKTFFAYMPSCESEILPFRPWQPHEYIDAKSQWERRQRKTRSCPS